MKARVTTCFFLREKNVIKNLFTLPTKKMNKHIEAAITVVPNYPKEGINFYDISSLLSHPLLREKTFDLMYHQCQRFLPADMVCGIDSRGFITGTSLASKSQISFVMVRKPGKLPGNLLSVQYGLEYKDESTLQIQRNAIKHEDRVIISDDLLATGGSLLGVVKLVRESGGFVVGCSVIVELTDLEGRLKLLDHGILLSSVLQMNKSGENVTKLETKLHTTTQQTLIQTSRMTDNKIVLFYHPTSQLLANSIRLRFPDTFRIVKASFDSYPDGSPNIDFFSNGYLRGANVMYLANLNDLGTVVEQQCFLIALSRQELNSLVIVIPYLKTGTDERIERPGKVAFVEPLSKILSTSLQMTASGPPKIQIFDVHATTTHFYFDLNKVNVRMLSATPLIKDIIKNSNPHTTVLAYPDDGACKRFDSLFSDLGLRKIKCGKVRIGNQRIVTVTEGGDYDPNTVHEIFLIDDLVMTGMTLHATRFQLQSLYPQAQISVYVTHAVFPNDGWKQFLPNGLYHGFHKFYVTNTIPQTCVRLYHHKLFVVLDIVPLIVEDVLHSNFSYYNTIFKKHNYFPIYLASKRREKIDAVEMAVKDIMGSKFAFRIIPVDILSNVNSQPMYRETMLGLRNRLKNLHQKFDQLSFINDGLLFAIESGCFKNYETSISDAALVACTYGTSAKSQLMNTHYSESIPDVFISSSPLVTPPLQYVLKAMSQNIPVGHILENELGYSQYDWQENFDIEKRNRIQLMSMPVKDTLMQFLQFYNE